LHNIADISYFREKSDIDPSEIYQPIKLLALNYLHRTD